MPTDKLLPTDAQNGMNSGASALTLQVAPATSSLAVCPCARRTQDAVLAGCIGACALLAEPPLWMCARAVCLGTCFVSRTSAADMHLLATASVRCAIMACRERAVHCLETGKAFALVIGWRDTCQLPIALWQRRPHELQAL